MPLFVAAAACPGVEAVKKWECYRDMMHGLLDGMTDAISGLPRSSNANRSHSYSFAYSDGYRSAKTGVAVKRDIVGEELAIKADLGVLT